MGCVLHTPEEHLKRLKVGASAVAGVGVFALEDIQKGEYVCRYYGILVEREQEPTVLVEDALPVPENPDRKGKRKARYTHQADPKKPKTAPNSYLFGLNSQYQVSNTHCLPIVTNTSR